MILLVDFGLITVGVVLGKESDETYMYTYFNYFGHFNYFQSVISYKIPLRRNADAINTIFMLQKRDIRAIVVKCKNVFKKLRQLTY